MIQSKEGFLPTSDKGSDFVVFKDTAGNDTQNDSDDEDEDEVPDLERVPQDHKPRQDSKDIHQETVEAKAGETWSEDDELDAEFALRYYLLHPGTELGHSHFFQGDFVRYITILASSKELKRLTLTITTLAVATTIDATVVDPKVLKPIFDLVEFKDILMQEKATRVLTRLAAIDKNAELIVNNGGLRCLLHLGTSEVKILRQEFSVIMVSLAKNVANAFRIASDKHIMAALLRLVQLDETETHENALSAISHLSNVENARPKLIEAGVLPMITRLLGTKSPKVVLLILRALMNVSKVAGTVEWFVQSAPRIIRTLKELLEKNLDQHSNEVLLLFLTQLASEETFQREIVGVGCLAPLLRLSRGQKDAVLYSLSLPTFARD
ncbi:hypothetical protein BGZ68_005302 [Mortierella alpina]|nr:hypothetical protein BGZ68_005302 [Mortierella alpina]